VNDKYALDGVNIEAGDDFSAIVGKAAMTTYKNCPYIEVIDLSKGLFRGPRPFFIKDLPFQACLEGAPDGVGTKVVIHDALKQHAGAARDVLAMTSTDITRFGGLPAVFYNVLDVRSLGENGSESFGLFVSALAELIKAANEQGIVVHKGETAELGACIGSDNPHANAPFNWAGFAIGIYSPDKMIYGDNVRPGDFVVALREYGFRSNGISSVRKAFQIRYGEEFYVNSDAEMDLRAAAVPSQLYDRFLTDMNGWCRPDFQPIIDVGLIAHLSGGGIGKFSELLAPTGLSAELDDLYDLPPIMRKCAEWRGMEDQEVYRTWNGGHGVLAVMPEDEAGDFVALATEYSVEAKTCGRIVSSDTTHVAVASKLTGKTLVF